MATEIDIAVTTTTYNVSITAEPNEYIVNITTNGGSGIESVTGTTVDNTDPLNPIVEVPNITQVLEQSDREYKEIIDASYTFIPSDGVKYMLNSDGTDLTFDDSDNSFLDKTEFPMKNQIDCTITFVDTDMRSNLGVDVNTPITTASLLKGDDISFKKIGSDPVWFMQVNRSGTEYLPLAGGTMDAGAEISFDNTSKLAEGSFDSGTGGANGISLFCAVGYEWNFQAGEGYLVRLSDNKIQVKEYARSVPTATDDSSKGFDEGSVWNMVDHNVTYVCADPTVGAAVWQAKEYTFDPATADINYVRNGITGWIEAYSKAQVDALLTAVARTGAVIAFDTDAVYNSIASPSSSNLTDDLTGARLKIVQKIYHNAGTAPTVPAGWVKKGTGNYVTSTLNIIYAEWSVGTTVEYWITQ